MTPSAGGRPRRAAPIGLSPLPLALPSTPPPSAGGGAPRPPTPSCPPSPPARPLRTSPIPFLSFGRWCQQSPRGGGGGGGCDAGSGAPGQWFGVGCGGWGSAVGVESGGGAGLGGSGGAKTGAARVRVRVRHAADVLWARALRNALQRLGPGGEGLPCGGAVLGLATGVREAGRRTGGAGLCWAMRRTWQAPTEFGVRVGAGITEWHMVHG